MLGLVGAGTIANQYTKLKKLHKTIQLNNNELVQLNNALNTKNEELTSVNETKNKLFSIIAHDLKNPFVSIYGFASIINDYALGKNDPELESLANTMLYSSIKLVELIDNLAKWSRLQQHRIEPVFTNFDIITEINNVVKQTMVHSQLKVINLTTDMDIQAFVFGDKEMIATIIRNILSNAIKFTPENGIIEIKCKTDQNFVEFAVKDSGIGISEERAEMILTGKKITSMDGTSKEKGTGLGLTICREFIQKNNGKFKIKSSLNSGAEFIVQFPAANIAQN